MTFIFLGAAALFVAGACAALWHLRWLRRLPPLDSSTPDDAASSQGKAHCSVIVAARDEEARIKQTVRRLLAQRGVALELIVVDDRSSDRTSEILLNLAQEDPRLRVIRIDALPDGWLGKCHACHIGANAATGDWILFTDADCWLTPDIIAQAVSVAERHGADHVTVTSGPSTKSPSLQASHLAFLIVTARWFSGANRDCPKSGIGFGAFNLVRAAAYRQCGGYEALRLTVVDDVKLGLLMRRAGKRTRAFIGNDDVEAHWGTNALSIIKIMEKNYFAALDYRTGLVLAGSVFVILLSTILVLGLISGTVAGLVAAISPLSLIVPGVILARRLNWSWLCAALIPFMFPVFHYALLNSTWKTLRHGGIHWRETFYSLRALRRENVR